MSQPRLPEGVRRHLLRPRHVGVVTEDLDALLARFGELFGLRPDEVQRVDGPDTNFAFFTIGGLPYEVIQPVSPRFRKMLLASNRGVNHVCYDVDDLDAAVAAMARAGVRLGHVTPDGIVETPRSRMAYFNPDDTGGVLIELVQARA